MKRGTLVALAVAGAFGSSVSFAQSFVCNTASDLSITDCAQASITTSTGNPVVIHNTPMPRAPEFVTVLPGRPHTTVTTYEYANTWRETEPSVSRYTYSHGPWIYYNER